MAGNERKVSVAIVGDAKGYKKATDDAVRASTGLGSKMEALDRKLQSIGRRGGLSGALLGGVGVGAGLGVFSLAERAIGGVVSALGDAVQSAIEDERATAKLTQTIQSNVRAWDGRLDAVNAAIDAGAQLAFTDDEVRDGLNQLIPRTKDVTQAIKLNALAMDLARAKGMDLESAATLVGKAYSGQASALRRAGIAIKNTKDSTKALAELQAAVSGQAATYADTTEGAMKRLDIQLSEALESLGYALKPLVASLAGLAAGIVSTVVPALGLFGEAMHNIQRIADPALAQTEDLNYAIIAQAGAYGVSADAVIRYKDAVLATRKAEADRLDLVKDLQENLSENDEYFKRQASQLRISADEAKNRFVEGQAKRIEAMAKALGMTLDEFRQAAPLISTAGDSVDSYLKRLALLSMEMRDTPPEVSAVTKSIAEQGLEWVRLTKAMQTIESAGAIVTGAFDGMFAGARKAARGIDGPGGPAASLRRTRTRMLTTMTEFMDPWKRAWAEAAEWAKDPFRPKKFEDWLEDRHKAALRKAREAAERGEKKIAERWRAVARAMKSPVITAVGEIKTSIAEVIRAMEIVDTVAKRTGTVRMGSTKKVAGRATGGPVKEGVAYEVGEVGRELFVPETDGTIIPNGALSRMGGGGTTVINHYHLTVNAGVGDPVAIGNQVLRYIRAASRKDGSVAVRAAVAGY